MEDDILSPRERGLRNRLPDQLPSRSRADLPGYKGELARVSEKKPTKQPYAEIAKAKLEAIRAADRVKKTLLSESIQEEDTFETVDTPTLPPVVKEEKVSKGVRGWWAKMFGGGE